MRLHKLLRLQGESAHCSGTTSPGDWGGWRSRGGRICLRYAPRSRLRLYLGLRGTHRVLSKAPWPWANAAAPDGVHPAMLGWGSSLSPPDCAGGWSSQSRALAWLWAGGQEGRQAGRLPSRSRRVGVRRRVRGTSGFRAPPAASPTAQPQVGAAGVGSGILGRSSTEPRPSGGGSLAEGLEMRLSNPAEASGNGIFGAKGGRNYKVTPSSPGPRNAKGL